MKMNVGRCCTPQYNWARLQQYVIHVVNGPGVAIEKEMHALPIGQAQVRREKYAVDWLFLHGVQW